MLGLMLTRDGELQPRLIYAVYRQLQYPMNRKEKSPKLRIFLPYFSRSLPWLIRFGSWIAQALPVVVPGEPDEGTDYTCFVEDSICIE